MSNDKTLFKRVTGALHSTIVAHGPITLEMIHSAAKRIAGELQPIPNELEQRLSDLKAELAKWRRIRTPTHGPCCTCQACGQFYDDCRCDLDEVADELAQLKQRHAEALGRWSRLRSVLTFERQSEPNSALRSEITDALAFMAALEAEADGRCHDADHDPAVFNRGTPHD